MAKKPAAPVDPNALVRTALLTAASASDRLKLTGKDGGLFASNKGANKDAIDRLLNPERPLLWVVRKEKTTEFVALTPAGLLEVADAVPEDKVGATARSVAEGLQTDDAVAFLQEFLPKVPTAAPDLEPLLAEAVKKQEAEVAARIEAERKRAERLEASRAAFQRCLDHMIRLRNGRIEELTGLLVAAGGTKPTLSKGAPVSQPSETTAPVATRKPVVPATAEEAGFRRRVAHRLVATWLESVRLGKAEGKRFMEIAIGNIDGMDPIADVGQTVAFDGKYHRAENGVSTGSRVTVVRPGWKLAEDGGEFVVEQALVKP